MEAYVDIAHSHGISPAKLALAFVRSRWFVTSTIIGARTMAQLQENISSDVKLDPDLRAELDAVHIRYPKETP